MAFRYCFSPMISYSHKSVWGENVWEAQYIIEIKPEQLLLNGGMQFLDPTQQPPSSLTVPLRYPPRNHRCHLQIHWPRVCDGPASSGCPRYKTSMPGSGLPASPCLAPRYGSKHNYFLLQCP